MKEILQACNLCAHHCKIDRMNGKKGICRASQTVKVALASLHSFEEPCISGENGSGTIFFSHCNLQCKYCQNYQISQEDYGKEVTIEHLADIMLNQQEKNAENINLVTPTMYVPQIIEAIKIAKSKGLMIPIVYNTNSYENVETIRSLEGYVDVYLPDLKYGNNEIAQKYSGCKDYFETATRAICEMYKQVGDPVIDENGRMKKGMIIRHLILPGQVENSKKVLKWIQQNLKDRVWVSVMAQYFPAYRAKQDPTLNRKITKKEYEQIQDYVFELDLTQGYIQELGEHEEEYVPEFDCRDV